MSRTDYAAPDFDAIERQRKAEARAELNALLPHLWQAIVDNTRHESAFWLGEILLSEVTKETGYAGPLTRLAN